MDIVRNELSAPLYIPPIVETDRLKELAAQAGNSISFGSQYWSTPDNAIQKQFTLDFANLLGRQPDDWTTSFAARVHDAVILLHSALESGGSLRDFSEDWSGTLQYAEGLTAELRIDDERLPYTVFPPTNLVEIRPDGSVHSTVFNGE